LFCARFKGKVRVVGVGGGWFAESIVLRTSANETLAKEKGSGGGSVRRKKGGTICPKILDLLGGGRRVSSKEKKNLNEGLKPKSRRQKECSEEGERVNSHLEGGILDLRIFKIRGDRKEEFGGEKDD